MTDEKSDVEGSTPISQLANIMQYQKTTARFDNIADTLQANLAIKNRDDDEGLKPVGHLATLIRTKSITARLDHIVDTSKVSLSISHCSKKVLPVESDEVLENVRWTTGRVDRQKELDAFVGLYPMYWLTLTFMDSQLEKEFIVFLTRKSLRSNRVMLALIFIAQVATSFPYMMAVNEERYTTLEFALVGLATFLLFATVVISVAVPQRHLDKFFLLLTQLEVIFVVFIIFGVLQYINSHLRLNYRTTFDPFVWNGYVVMIFLAAYVVRQRFIYSVLCSLVAVVGSWAALSIDNTKWTFVNSLSIPFVYGTLSVTTAFYCWERERLWRNTFLLEKFLTARHKAGVVDIDDETKTADEEGSIPKATIEMNQRTNEPFRFTQSSFNPRNIWRSIKTQTFSDAELEKSFQIWRHRAVLLNMRFHLIVLIYSDLASPFLDRNSYCDASKLFITSPSLCGSKGFLIQMIRHADLPVLFVGLGLTWSRYLKEHHQRVHILIILIFTIRAIIIQLILYVILSWDLTDTTKSLFLSYLATMQFGACGPYNLNYQHHAILSIPIIIGIVAVFLYAQNIMVANNVYVSSLFAISCAYMDEGLERNFFSLREMALRQ